MSRRRAKEPDLGPYEIEVPQHPLWGFDTDHCNVVRLPRPTDPDEAQGGFVTVFSGTFAECDAWIEEHPE